MKLRLPFRFPRERMQLGFPGAIGVGALAMCLALYFSTVRPAQQRRDDLRASVSALQERIALAGPFSRDKERPLDEQLAAFYRTFPAEQDATDAVGKIVAIAQRGGLTVQQADYKLERDKTGKLARFEMSMPLKGEYRSLRRFLVDVHTELPTLSLEQVQFERQKVGDSQVDAKVRLVIFVGRPS